MMPTHRRRSKGPGQAQQRVFCIIFICVGWLTVAGSFTAARTLSQGGTIEPNSWIWIFTNLSGLVLIGVSASMWRPRDPDPDQRTMEAAGRIVSDVLSAPVELTGAPAGRPATWDAGGSEPLVQHVSTLVRDVLAEQRRRYMRTQWLFLAVGLGGGFVLNLFLL